MTRSWLNEPARYVFLPKGKILRLIKGPDGHWSQEEPQPISAILAAADFASLEGEMSVMQSFVQPFKKDLKFR